jgi:hypothetical protein
MSLEGCISKDIDLLPNGVHLHCHFLKVLPVSVKSSLGKGAWERPTTYFKRRGEKEKM